MPQGAEFTKGFRHAGVDGVLEDALSRPSITRNSPWEYAQTEFYLARALWEANRDRDFAKELARNARDVFAAHVPVTETDLAKVEAWLAERR